MKKINLSVLALVFCLFNISAQITTVKGLVRSRMSDEPISGVTVTLLSRQINTVTNYNGEFQFAMVDAGDDEIRFVVEGYFPQIRPIKIIANQTNDLGKIVLTPDEQSDARQDVLLQITESQLNDEGSAQVVSAQMSSASDVYLSQTGYSFSPMRFRTRGYDNKYESTYINGVHFLDAERGGFNYSSIGGLNNATRNKDVVYGLMPSTFAYGNLGANTNINTRASSFAAGSNANVALSNRAYKIRGQYTYGTGITNSGWAFAVSGVVRWADDNNDWLKLVEGTFYNSAGLLLSAEKIINDKHSLSLVAFGAPTRRAGQAPITQEARNLTGSIYYNPYWGEQNGKVRHSRIIESFDPTAVISHDWKISDNQRLRTGLGFHYSWYSNSAFSYNGTHPSPDYYRAMPSFITDDVFAKDRLTTLWSTDKYTQQTKWDEMYQANARNNATDPTGQAAYALIRRHNNLVEATLNSVYSNRLNKNLKLTAGLEARTSQGQHYQTIDDLMGANQLIDNDTYAERDLVGGTLQDADPRMIENDMNDKNKNKHKGDIFGYNYNMNVQTTNAYAQLEYKYEQINLYAGIQGTYTGFYRYGYMENGRAWYLRQQGHDNVKSLGKSDTWWFLTPSAKVGFAYNINNRSQIAANLLAEQRAPLVQDAYVSERIKDALVPNLESEKILSYDLNYTFNYPAVRGRVSGFRTNINESNDKLGYYDDEYRTFINHLLSGANKVYQGVEIGLSTPINSMFTLSAAGTYADYRYTNNAIGTKSYENGAKDDVQEVVMTKGLKINAGPQFAANITLDFFYKMWFADITLNYYDNNYLDFAPNRFTESIYGNLPAEFYGKKNMDMLREHFIDQNGNVHVTQLQEWLTNSDYKAYWGLAEDKAMEFGKYGDIIQKDATGKATGIEVSEIRQKLGTQEKLQRGFVLDASIGKVFYMKNRNQLNINISLSNILNNTNLISGGYQQARIPYTDASASKINAKALNWFANKYYYATGFNFFLSVGYKFSASNNKQVNGDAAAFEELQAKPEQQIVVVEQPKPEPVAVAVEKPVQENKVIEKPVQKPEIKEVTKPTQNNKAACVFAGNSYTLSNEAKAFLDTFVGELKSDASLLVILKGHTDNTGNAKYNLQLSEKRANSVKQYFVNKGIAAKRILTAGFGDTKPIADNNTAEGRSQNRRVEIIIE